MGVGVIGRAVAFAGLSAFVGCGISITGAAPEGQGDSGLPVVDAGTDHSSIDGGEDAIADAPLESGPPPSYAHVPAGTFDPNAPNVAIVASAIYRIDTTAGTIDTGAGAAPSPTLNVTSDVAVWSVGKLEVFGKIEVVGRRPLAIVASNSVVIDGTIDASARGAASGPGGGPATKGTQPGTDGMIDDEARGGGGGAGHGQAGGVGAKSGDAQGGGAGATYNETGENLVGGSGGGHGGGFAPGRCEGRGRGGAGGGALQLSTLMSITIGPQAILDVRATGGRGGCRSNSGQEFSAGGGGGSGGLVYLEAARAITLRGIIDARGGGGGEGGGDNNDGKDAEPANAAPSPANGGDGNGSGGGGGDGGSANREPQDGRGGGNAGGGGGGAVGRVVFHTRGIQPTIAGSAVVAAKQFVDDGF